MAVIIAVVVAIAAGGAVLMRFGLRGAVGSRVLARMLHASAGQRRMALLSGQAHTRVFGAARGRLLGRWFGAPVLVIETTGRHSGLPRRTPIVYAGDGDRFVVTPANAGADRMPAWWLNLREMRMATVVVAGRHVAVGALEADGTEHERLWRLLVAMSPAIAHYQDFTERRFPVVVLDPLPVTEGAAGRTATVASERTLGDRGTDRSRTQPAAANPDDHVGPFGSSNVHYTRDGATFELALGAGAAAIGTVVLMRALDRACRQVPCR